MIQEVVHNPSTSTAHFLSVAHSPYPRVCTTSKHIADTLPLSSDARCVCVGAKVEAGYHARLFSLSATKSTCIGLALRSLVDSNHSCSNHMSSHFYLVSTAL